MDLPQEACIDILSQDWRFAEGYFAGLVYPEEVYKKVPLDLETVIDFCSKGTKPGIVDEIAIYFGKDAEGELAGLLID